MSIFSFFKLFGGLAFFLYGMNLLSTSLEKTAGGGLEKLLRKMTDNPFKGLLAGALITIAIQSSSATTVMLVGFVNSGIMELSQTVGVIFGADVGTTLTAWILSLAGIDGGDNILLGMIKPANFSMIFALIGLLMLMTGKRQKTKDIGSMGIGFAILMYGMTMMSDSMAPLADMPQFGRMMMMFNNPLVGVLIGMVITGVIQGSAATIGVLQGLSMTGQVSLGMAIPIVMGANIGTCMTAILSSFGVNRKAKRVSAIHVGIKVVGTALWLVVFYGLNHFLHFEFLNDSAKPFNIALFHTIFNVVNTIVLFGFQKYFVKIAYKIFPDTEEEEELFLDERLMVTPSIALAEVENAMDKMVKKAGKNLDRAIGMLSEGYSQKAYDKIRKNEEKIDAYEDHIGSYLMKLTSHQLSERDKKKSTRIFQSIGEFERLADYASDIADSSMEMVDKKVKFSKKAREELEKTAAACREIYTDTIQSFENADPTLARRVEPLQEIIGDMCSTYKTEHVKRLTNGTCTTKQGFIFNDLMYSCERISEHCMNIAAIVFRTSDANYDSQKYLHDVKRRKDPANEALYQAYYKKYME